MRTDATSLISEGDGCDQLDPRVERGVEHQHRGGVGDRAPAPLIRNVRVRDYTDHAARWLASARATFRSSLASRIAAFSSGGCGYGCVPRVRAVEWRNSRSTISLSMTSASAARSRNRAPGGPRSQTCRSHARTRLTSSAPRCRRSVDPLDVARELASYVGEFGERPGDRTQRHPFKRDPKRGDRVVEALPQLRVSAAVPAAAQLVGEVHVAGTRA